MLWCWSALEFLTLTEFRDLYVAMATVLASMHGVGPTLQYAYAERFGLPTNLSDVTISLDQLQQLIRLYSLLPPSSHPGDQLERGVNVRLVLVDDPETIVYQWANLPVLSWVDGRVVRVGLVWSQDAVVDTTSLETFYHNLAQALGFQVVEGPFTGITYYTR